MIKIKLDLAKMTGVKVVAGKSGNTTYLDITNARLFKGKTSNGHTPYYLSLVAMETKPTQYGDWRDDQTHMVVEDMNKEERTAGKKGAILGNGSDTSKRRTNDQPPADPAPAAESPIDNEDSDLPF